MRNALTTPYKLQDLTQPDLQHLGKICASRAQPASTHGALTSIWTVAHEPEQEAAEVAEPLVKQHQGRDRADPGENRRRYLPR